MENKIARTIQTKTSWKGEEIFASSNREKAKEYKKLSIEVLQEKIKKGLSFKCREKWGKGEQMLDWASVCY